MIDTLVFVNSIIIVGIWMVLIQLWRYADHSKNHDNDSPDSKAYKLSHKVSTIYWGVPAIFVVIAALTGQVISGTLNEFVKLNGSGCYVAMMSSMVSYIAMDIQSGNKSIVTKLCDALYYLFVEKNYEKAKPEIDAIKKRISELPDPKDMQIAALMHHIDSLRKELDNQKKE